MIDQGAAKRLGIHLVGARLNGGPQRLNVLRVRTRLAIERFRDPAGDPRDIELVGICRLISTLCPAAWLCGHPGGLGLGRTLRRGTALAYWI